MNPAHRGSIAVLLLRLVAGVAFLFHGWGKIQNPMHWMDKAPNPRQAFCRRWLRSPSSAAAWA